MEQTGECDRGWGSRSLRYLTKRLDVKTRSAVFRRRRPIASIQIARRLDEQISYDSTTITN